MSDFFSRIKKWARPILRKAPPIYWGKFPPEAPKGAVLLFPVSPCILRCGLAAILEFKSSPPSVPCLARLFSDLPSELRLDTFLQENQKWLERIEQETLLKEDALFCALLNEKTNREVLSAIADALRDVIRKEEKRWDLGEKENAVLVRLRDIAWKIEKEHLSNWKAMERLASGPMDGLPFRSIKSYRRINTLFNMLDRLEIRGRDSAGISFVVPFSRDGYASFEKNLAKENLDEELGRRLGLQDLVSTSVKKYELENEVRLSFVFKVCAEIGKLGDNVKELKNAVKKDLVFHRALSWGCEPITYLAHTRWASNGIINIFNCHPLDNEVLVGEEDEGVRSVLEIKEGHSIYPKNGHIFVVLNGDIDNYESLKSEFERTGISVPSKITTDAKIIALKIQEGVVKGASLKEAFRMAVQSFSGSHAIAMHSDLETGKIFLALKGSGQAIYVGLAGDRYVVASEVYGLVEDTSCYIAMDGETPFVPGKPETRGEVFILDEKRGGIEGIEAFSYDGHPIPSSSLKILKAGITTRDIDRQQFPHFFAKEVHQARYSVLNTIKGKFSTGEEPRLFVEEIVTPEIRKAVQVGEIGKIYVIGQGTASIAASAIAHRIRQTLPDNFDVRSFKSSELSGFCLKPAMKDTLVIAVTQSGTTTDTNRAVDMARERGARTMAIVNRRNSHITSMVQGVFYTSDGRDIEMAVASTKAFYSQVTAGELLSLALGEIAGSVSSDQLRQRLDALKTLPQLLDRVLGQESQIAQIAQKWAPRYPHWAVVGSGANRIAAEEVRIKLSELCYKSIACDFVEDKKHIDLSSEPLILVCSAGTQESVLGDIVKDVAIFKAHDSAPIVIAHEGEYRFAPYAASIIVVPKADELSSLILNTMAGHLFGYHAACALNEQSLFFATLRSKLVEKLTHAPADAVLADPDVQMSLVRFLKEFHYRKQQGVFNASLSPALCADVALLLSYACGGFPIQGFGDVFGASGNSKDLMELLVEKLHLAIAELSRSIDAIKHQAKTVTVGTSRIELSPQEPRRNEGKLFDKIFNTGISQEALRHPIVHRLQNLQPAIAEVLGHSYYEISGLDATGQPNDSSRIQLISREGISKRLPSRSARHPVPLVGTKRAVVSKGEVFIGIGMGDKRPLIIIPLFSNKNIVSHQLLLHIRFTDRLEADESKALLADDYEDIRNMVTEANVPWNDGMLASLAPEFLCTHGAREIGHEIIVRNSKNKES